MTLDLPLGSHLDPMPAGADLRPPALANLIADALEALELEDVTLIGNDTGGALTQLVATSRPERVGAIVLTSCDAFENFPPRLFRVALAPARLPGAIPFAFGALRLRRLRRLPFAFGWLTTAPIDRDAEDSYVLPVLTRRAIRPDVRKLLGGLDPAYTLDAAAKLTSWRKPALIAWSADDRFFPRRARRAPRAGDPGRATRVDRGRTDVLAGGPPRATRRADPGLRPHAGPRRLSRAAVRRGGGSAPRGCPPSPPRSSPRRRA